MKITVYSVISSNEKQDLEKRTQKHVNIVHEGTNLQGPEISGNV